VSPDREAARKLFLASIDTAYHQGWLDAIDQQIRNERCWPAATAKDIACFVKIVLARHDYATDPQARPGGSIPESALSRGNCGTRNFPLEKIAVECVAADFSLTLL
jgi:hypothetical protein